MKNSLSTNTKSRHDKIYNFIAIQHTPEMQGEWKITKCALCIIHLTKFYINMYIIYELKKN